MSLVTNKYVRKILLILSLLLVVFLPLIGSYIKFNSLPPGYGEFPIQKVVEVPGFDQTLFYVGVLIVVLISVVFLFPRFLGFNKVKTRESHFIEREGKYPWWFFGGIALFIFSLIVFWGFVSFNKFINSTSFVPLWWGFILFLDGLVFYRNNGSSLLSRKPQIVFLLAVISSLGWFLFEYLDYFILQNWYYPNNEIFSVYGNSVWFMFSYTIIFPQIFELYHLFLTIPGLKNRWANGPIIKRTKGSVFFLIILGVVVSVVMGYFPFQLFCTVWINPVLIMAGILSLLKIPTLFSPMRNGDWTKPMLIAIAMFVSGLLWEFFNYGSELFNDPVSINPSFWKYSIPYVNDVKLPFSEMPVLGYWGYIPYGWVCWLQWSLSSKLFGFNENLSLESNEEITLLKEYV